MEKIKKLNYFQKTIMIVMILMILIFALVYPKIISRVGYRYTDEIMVMSRESGNTIYSGKINGEQSEFIVSDNQSVVFQHGNTIYGPYTMEEDPTAVPEKEGLTEQLLGVNIYNKDQLIFRGGILEIDNGYVLFNEDGTMDNFGLTYVDNTGIERDENGNVVDRIQPSAYTIYELLNEPELTHKGEASVWFGGVFICFINALSILFVDELFRFSLAFRIRNADNAEPSDLEIAGRYIGWTIITVVALVVFILGLK